MHSLHFEINSGKHGAASYYSTYITRQGRFKDRSDLIDTGYGNMPSWAQENPRLLWKASDIHERKNGSTFRSFTISLPNALSIEQLKELALEEANRIAGSKPFQYALHILCSSLQGEPNPHVHIMICERLKDGIERSPFEMFRRYNARHPEKGGCKKDSGGRTREELRDQVISQREAAAEAINEALTKYGHDIRVDHRSLKERGIHRAPERYLGPAKIRKMTPEERKSFVEMRRSEYQAPQ